MLVAYVVARLLLGYENVAKSWPCVVNHFSSECGARRGAGSPRSGARRKREALTRKMPRSPTAAGASGCSGVLGGWLACVCVLCVLPVCCVLCAGPHLVQLRRVMLPSCRSGRHTGAEPFDTVFWCLNMQPML